MRVAVCVVTYRRPEGLRRLLESLCAQTFRDDPPELEIVVVDNEADGTSAAVCDSFRADSKWPIRHEVEPRRGIPFARNKAVGCVLDTADFVAFIDDDEVAEPDWLDELLRIQRETGAAVVTGPVEPYFPEPVAEWIVRGRFFESRRYPTGKRVDVAYTHNVLTESRVYRGMKKHFDEKFIMTGGSDSDFFRRVQRAGNAIVWVDSALVREWIPPTRANLAWLVRRWYRYGIMFAVIAMSQSPGWWMRFVSAGKAVVWIVIGAFVSLGGLVAGRHVMANGIRLIAYGVGEAAAIVGARYQEYEKTHGS